jgi:carotenoid 1,2-hydratase
VIPEAIGDRLFPLDGRRLHRWWPTAPRCRIEVAMERPALRWRGTGYHDTNAGDRALEDDFARWDWSRGASRDGGIVLYDVEGRERTTTIAVRVDRTGRSHDFAPPARTALPRTLWGLERKARSEDASGPRVAETLEDTPFYARSVVSARLLGESVTSVHESLSLDRFRTAWVQTLLPFRMRRAR